MLLNLNNLKTFYNALVLKMKGFRGNWEQNDPTADDYIKNKPFWIENELTTLLSETTVEVEEDYVELPYVALKIGETYTVIFNGTTYKCTARAWGEDCVLIGNGQIYGDGIVSNDEPFSCDCYPNGEEMYLNVVTSGTYTIKIAGEKTTIHKLDKKFIDMPDNIITEENLYDMLAPVSFSNDYRDLNNLPDVYTKNEVYVVNRSNIRTSVYDCTYQGDQGIHMYVDGVRYCRISNDIWRPDQVERIESHWLSNGSQTMMGSYPLIGKHCFGFEYGVVITKAGGECSFQKTTHDVYGDSHTETFTFYPPASGIYVVQNSLTQYVTRVEVEYYDLSIPSDVVGVVRTINGIAPDSDGDFVMTAAQIGAATQTEVATLSGLVGDTAVAAQISDAISSITTGTTVVKNAEHADTAGSATTADTAKAVAWNNITGRPGAFTPAEHTHDYAGSSTAGGAANSANKLNSNAGSATQPVYFEGGVPKATTYTLGKSVPSDAKFTDTTYSAATQSAAGLMSVDDKKKLDGIATGANKITVDSALSSTSTNPVQNKIVNTAISNLNSLVGNKSVATQINEALVAITIDEIDAICGGSIMAVSEVTY